jgi:hypothetical protein
MQFLYDVSKADGADPTRGGSAARNGEPFGEIGLVTTGDADYGAQQGGPRDPQPGHLGNPSDGGSLGFTVAPVAPATISATVPTTITSGSSSTGTSLAVVLPPDPSS